MQRLGSIRCAAALVVAALIVVGCGTPDASPPPASSTAAATNEASAATWQPGPEAPLALTEHATAVHDGQIWIAGGLTADGKATDRVFSLDPSTGTWTEQPTLPEPIHHSALVSDGSTLSLLGGYVGDAFDRPTDAVRHLSPATTLQAWSAGDPLPAPRAAGAAVWDGSRIVYGGGVGPGVLSDLVVVSVPNGYEPVARLSRAREHLAAATDGAGRTWFLGGRQNDLASNLSRVDVVEGKTAEVAGEMPTARGGVAAFWWPSLGACLLGGESPSAAHREVECLAPDGSTTTLPPLTVPRHGFGAAVIDGVAYALLGGDVPALSVSSSVETLALPD